MIDNSGVFAGCLLPGIVPEMMRGRALLTGVPSHSPGPTASRQGQARPDVFLESMSFGCQPCPGAPIFQKREMGTPGKILAQIEVASLKNAEIFEKL